MSIKITVVVDEEVQVLCGKVQRGGQSPSREPFWHPSEWYKYRGDHHQYLSGTSCKHKSLTTLKK